MAHSIKAIAAAGMLLSFIVVAQAADSPYVGQEKRAIKALSEQEVSDYLNGRGMGTSKVAELNRYPGPRHVLDDAKKLGLSAAQLRKTKNVHDAMTQIATRIGKEIVHEEAELEALYANQKATPENTERLVRKLANLQADFRLAHLNAHLKMRQILSKQQIEMYDHVRGYGGTKSHKNGHKHH
jgi:hypothetical protein